MDIDDRELQDSLITLQEKLFTKLQEYLLPSAEELLRDLLFVVEYQNDSRHTYKLTREALLNLVEKYKNL